MSWPRCPAPQISFNYLGRFTAVHRRPTWTPVAGHGMLAGGFDLGMPVAPYTLEINAFVAGHRGRTGAAA